MNSEIKTSILEANKPEYPCLKIYKDNDFIVLFTDPTTGTVVYSTYYDHKVGDYDNDWISSGFKPFNDILELSN